MPEEPWEYAFERQCKQQLQELTDTLANDGAKDFSDYRFLCGQIRGIQFALDALIRMRERFNPDEDQDLKDNRP